MELSSAIISLTDPVIERPSKAEPVRRR